MTGWARVPGVSYVEATWTDGEITRQATPEGYFAMLRLGTDADELGSVCELRLIAGDGRVLHSDRESSRC